MVKLKVILCGVALALPSVVVAQTAQAEPGTAKRSGVNSSNAKTATDQASGAQTTSPLPESEQRALLDMHKLNQGEISVGSLAPTRAVNSAVKQYAQHLITDHKQSDEKVVSMAKRRSVALATILPTSEQAAKEKKHEALLQRLKSLKGQDFDREFAQAMVEGHRNAISDVQKALANCKDPELHTLLEQTLPKLNQHLQGAEQLATTRGTAPITPAPMPTP